MKKCKKIEGNGVSNIKESLKLTTLGFTLVELLAVIVILAIILVIAVPQIMNTIKDSTKASLESSAKMVASQVENQYTVAKVLGKEFKDTGSCMEDWAGLNNTDYKSCTYEIVDGEARVTIEGIGKFNGLSVCSATRSSASAQEESCAEETLVSHIQSLYANETTRTENGLTKDNTVDENIRYSGSNDVVKNYVEFGNIGETWRIIGIFEMETADGKTEELVKIVREDSIGNMSWDSSDSTINQGYGINQWGPSVDYLGADLMQLLNGYYIGKSGATCTYCNDYNQATCTNDCSSTVTPINSTYKSMIESVVWNTGAWGETVLDTETMAFNPVALYNQERGTVNGKVCSATNEDGTANTSCNDTVTRTTTWEGLVALPYTSDWGYASSEEVCKTDLWAGADKDEFDFTNTKCKLNNWMHYGTTDSFEEATWMLSPVADSDVSDFVSVVDGVGTAYGVDGNLPLRVRPTLYLKSNIQIEDGDGSSENAYKLK